MYCIDATLDETMQPSGAEISRRHGRGKTVIKRLTPDGLGVRTTIEYHESTCARDAVAQVSQNFSQSGQAATLAATARHESSAGSRLLANLSIDDSLLSRSSPVRFRVVKSAPSSKRSSPMVHLPGGRSVSGFDSAQREMLEKSHAGFQGTPGHSQHRNTSQLSHSAVFRSSSATQPYAAAASAPASPGFPSQLSGGVATFRPTAQPPALKMQTAASPGMLVHVQSCQSSPTLHDGQSAVGFAQTGISGTSGQVAKEPEFTPSTRPAFSQNAARPLAQYYGHNDDAASVASSAVGSTASSGRFSAAVASALHRADLTAHQHAETTTGHTQSAVGHDKALGTSVGWRAAPAAQHAPKHSGAEHGSRENGSRPPKAAAKPSMSAHRGISDLSADGVPVSARREGTAGEPRSHSSMGGHAPATPLGAAPVAAPAPPPAAWAGPKPHGRLHGSLGQALASHSFQNGAVVAAAAGVRPSAQVNA